MISAEMFAAAAVAAVAAAVPAAAVILENDACWMGTNLCSCGKKTKSESFRFLSPFSIFFL